MRWFGSFAVLLSVGLGLQSVQAVPWKWSPFSASMVPESESPPISQEAKPDGLRLAQRTSESFQLGSHERQPTQQNRTGTCKSKQKKTIARVDLSLEFMDFALAKTIEASNKFGVLYKYCAQGCCSSC